jgi:hypothetical protein
VGTTTYDNLLDFCNATREYSDWSSCTSRGFNVESNGGSWSSYGNTRPVVQAKTPGALIHLFHADAERMFGAENYFVESIVFTPDGPCVPAAGQSYATELMAISSSPEQVHPICESYAPALMHVDQFAQGLLQTEYTVVLEERESIVSVTVHSLDGSTRQLTPDDYQHDMATGQLVINRDALRAADLDLSVEVEDPCAPIIR